MNRAQYDNKSLPKGFYGIGREKLKILASQAGIDDAEYGEPLFSHDCDKCVYVGTYEYTAEGWGLVDLYVCPSGSIVYRYGNEGSEYGSMSIEYCLLENDTDPEYAYHSTLRNIFSRGINDNRSPEWVILTPTIVIKKRRPGDPTIEEDF